MEQILDISLPLDATIPLWPGSEGLELSTAMSIEAGDAANVTVIRCDVHTGTHIDAPLHVIHSGKSTDELSLETFMGPVYIADLSGLAQISIVNLEQAAIPMETSRLLLRTDNSARLRSNIFDVGYTYLTPEAASWIADRGITLFGFDYLSIEQYGAAPLAHVTLLNAGTTILEGINLYEIKSGWYELICLPLRLIGKEGAPARALLKTHRSNE